MAIRTTWKGYLRVSMATIPVRLYNAVDASTTISFNQLHRTDHGRIGYDKQCRTCGESVRSTDIVKGYQYAPDEYAVITDEDLSKVRVKSTRIIEITGFVQPPDQTLFDTPYFVGPDGVVANKGYALLAKALKSSGQMGVGKVVLRDREDLVLVGHHEAGLMLYKVRHPQYIRSFADVPGVETERIDRSELKMVRSLVDAMQTTLDQVDMRDSYQEAVKELVQAKIDGREVVVSEEPDRPVVDIMDALRQSIELAGQSKPKRKTKSAA